MTKLDYINVRSNHLDFYGVYRAGARLKELLASDVMTADLVRPYTIYAIRRCLEQPTIAATYQHMTLFTPNTTQLKVSGEQENFVYIVRAGSGLYKIGRSQNLRRRLIDLRIGDPTIELTLSIATNNAVGLEEELHDRFFMKRKVGEWFALSSDDIEALTEKFGTSPNKSSRKFSDTTYPHRTGRMAQWVPSVCKGKPVPYTWQHA